jgi:hypothetical protein
LRIKVCAAAHRDYLSLSFYLDATKPWNGPAYMPGSEIIGSRRRDILAAVGCVREICQVRMVPDQLGIRAIDGEVIPEHGVSAEGAAALLQASKYLYSDLWGQFSQFVGVQENIALDACRVTNSSNAG